MSNSKYLVVINPVPNRARKKILDKLLGYLNKKNINWQIYPTEQLLSANKHYFESYISQYSDVLVVGGDGTFHNVINALGCFTDVKLGLVPAGTGNDFARWLYGKNRHNYPFIFEQVTRSQTVDISLGKCVFSDNSVRFFHNVLGLGFDAMLAKELRHNKGLFPSLGYLSKAIKKLPFYKESELDLSLGNEQKQYFNLITAFANSAYFGSGMKIAPDAEPIHDTLEMCRIEKLPVHQTFSQILRLFNGSHIDHKGVDYRTISHEAQIKTVGLDVEADGEYLGQSPCQVSIVKKALKIKRP